jgi:hypothetical protein
VVSGTSYKLTQVGLPTDSTSYSAAATPDVKIYSAAISPNSLEESRMEQVYPAVGGSQKVACAYEADTAAPLLIGTIQTINLSLESNNDANGSWYTPNTAAGSGPYRINLVTVATWEPNCEMTDQEAKDLFALCDLEKIGLFQRDAVNPNLWSFWATQKIYFAL